MKRPVLFDDKKKDRSTWMYQPSQGVVPYIPFTVEDQEKFRGGLTTRQKLQKRAIRRRKKLALKGGLK